jgi:hypothetical protein
VITQIKAVGARWFTKGNMLYWRITINGKVTDVPNSKYYIEKGALLLTDYNTGKKCCITRNKYYWTKLNLLVQDLVLDSFFNSLKLFLQNSVKSLNTGITLSRFVQ